MAAPVQQAQLVNGSGHGTPPRRQAWGGLLVRRERWTFSLTSKLLLFLMFVTLTMVLIRGMYSFLAVTSPVSAKLLVVEGWMPSYLVDQVARQYEAGKFAKILVVRPLRKARNPYESGDFEAHYLTDTLVNLGVPKDRVEIVFHEPSKRDRTYQSALAVKKWLRENNFDQRAINVATLGPHARRSRLLFERAFEGKSVVGTIALNEQLYDPDHWWRSSEGVREVPFELVAYLYVKFSFFPNQHE